METDRAAALRERRRHSYENQRPDVQELVPAGARRILDLGCSSGALGAALRERQGSEVVGVELDPVYAGRARSRLDEVVEADLEVLFADPGEVAALGRFDCLVAADVLEHLRDPWSVMRAAARTLSAGGTAVISVPNVRYWETFRELGVRGSWPRREEGIFDATHLSWFTLSDARGLLTEAGLEPTRVRPVYRLRPSDWRTEGVARRLAVGPLRPFLAFQYVIAARRPA
jgi:2-polyprenyl-3-methyl-5-hydroxy-6-metoxy-1,4-benzoquinol methylase